jgi:glycosyltransferase involved in cell wall biosynthesis
MGIRVLYVNHTSHVSGAERSLLDLLRGLPSDIEPVVAAPAGDLTSRLCREGFQVIPIQGVDASLRLHPVWTSRAIAEMMRTAAALRWIARRVGADLVHANSIRAGLLTSLAARLGGPPTVVHLRDRLPEGLASNTTMRILARGSAGIIANSAWTLAGIDRFGTRATRRVIHSPVDTERFHPGAGGPDALRAELGIGDAWPVLGVIGQVTPWKGQDDAIRVTALLRRDFPWIHLLLVGSPKFVHAQTRYDNRAYEAQLHRLVDELGIGSHVTFLDEREDIPDVLSTLDLSLVPSWNEPFGRVVAESLATGVPVAATMVGGPREVITDGENGLLLPPRQPSTWAAAIGALVADPPRLCAMAEAGPAFARTELSLEQHVRRVREFYRQVAERDGRRVALSRSASRARATSAR